MFTGNEIVELLRELRFSHVVMVPDSTLGLWEQAIDSATDLRLVRVCREGEAWAVAAGLYLAGQQPLVMIQCTGLFESGDSLRNALHDYQLPLFAMIGYRSYLNQKNLPGDTAMIFTEPILKAWNVDFHLIDEPAKISMIREFHRECTEEQKPGVVLIAEGRA
ncbi:MAG: thiamine pyrophosphate-binding protein [Planctomycetaceae bacterium]